MKPTSEPELKRVPLEEVCLSILASGLSKSCEGFLKQAPQPPTNESIEAALLILEQVGAVTSSKDALTPLGHHLAKLPVDVRLGKMLILGSMFNCLDRVLTIAASLSSRSPFGMFVNDAAIAKAKHKRFEDLDSDFATLCNVWDGYSLARSASPKSGRDFCQSNYLNQAAMHEIRTARQEFLNLLCTIGFVSKDQLATYNKPSWTKCQVNSNSNNWKLVNAVSSITFLEEPFFLYNSISSF
jgi:HrpA-like RNA helicase